MSPLDKEREPVVLHVRVVTGRGGGPEKTILNSPRFLHEMGYRSACAYLHPPRDPGFHEIEERGARLGARVLSIPDRGPWDLSVLTRLAAICRGEGVSIWHGHDYKSNLLGVLLRKLRPMRLVTTVHGWVTYTRRTPLYYKIDRRCLPHYERVICVSPDLRDVCLQAGVSPERCVVVENAIDTEQYSRRRGVEDAKRSLGLPPGRCLIGAVGRLSEEKGFDHLIRAVGRLRNEGEDVGLVIVGEGDARLRLESLIDSLALADRVSLVGYSSNPIEWYEAMDVYALSSLREGLPNTVLEAMALEVPVVATRVAGIPALIEDGVNGLLVRPNSEEELATALKKVVRNPELRSSLRAAGRNVIVERCSFRRRMEKMCRIYEEVLQQSPTTVQMTAKP